MNKHYVLQQREIDLLQKNIIDIYDDTEADLINYIREALLWLRTKGSPDIEVKITSNGGSMDIGLHVYDELRNYSGKKTGIVAGFARSMGAIILQACDNRYCHENSLILIHHISRSKISLDQITSKKKNRAVRKDMEQSQKILYSILMDKTGKKKKEIIKVCKKDKSMRAKKALAFGLIDKIL